MARVKCLACDVENDALATGGYCDNCGKKLPTSALVKTRRTLQADEDQADPLGVVAGRSPTVEALIVAAVVHLVAGGLFLMVAPALIRQVPPDYLAKVLTWSMVPSLVLGGMAFLAQRWPGPVAWTAVLAVPCWMATTFGIDAGLALPWLLVQVVLLALVGWAVFVSSRKGWQGEK